MHADAVPRGGGKRPYIGDFADPYGKEEVFAAVEEMGRFQGVVEPADITATMKRAGALSDARPETKGVWAG